MSSGLVDLAPRFHLMKHTHKIKVNSMNWKLHFVKEDTYTSTRAMGKSMRVESNTGSISGGGISDS
jgi:hypothetical protein